MAYLLNRDILTADIFVEQRLVIAAGKFDDNVLNGLLKFTIADQTYVELARLTQPVCLANDHDRMLLEGSDNALYSIDRFRVLRPDLCTGIYP